MYCYCTCPAFKNVLHCYSAVMYLALWCSPTASHGPNAYGTFTCLSSWTHDNRTLNLNPGADTIHLHCHWVELWQGKTRHNMNNSPCSGRSPGLCSAKREMFPWCRACRITKHTSISWAKNCCIVKLEPSELFPIRTQAVEWAVCLNTHTCSHIGAHTCLVTTPISQLSEAERVYGSFMWGEAALGSPFGCPYKWLICVCVSACVPSDWASVPVTCACQMLFTKPCPFLLPPLAKRLCSLSEGSEAKRQACLCAVTARSCLFRWEVDEVNCESVSAPFEM